MYRIAICDDENSTCNQLELYLEQYMKRHYVSFEIQIFYSGETLCEFLNYGNTINCIFLDIELPGINGVQIGKYLREILENEMIDIIYISSKTNYAMELFQCRPLDFLVKPLSYEKIEKVLNISIKKGGVRSKNFEFHSEGRTQKLLLSQILYFRSDNKKIYIVLNAEEEKCFNGKLDEVEKRVPKDLFLRIHKSYLINFDYVLEYRYEYVKIVNGDVLTISKAHRKGVKAALIQYER